MGTTKNFVHLHVHTEFSMLDGAAPIKPLASTAANLGMPAIAITDHGNMHGAYAMHKASTAAGIKPIIGIEAYIAPESRRHTKAVFWGQPHQRKSNDATGEGGDVSGSGAYLHMTLLAETPDGLRNLMRLSTLAYTEGFLRKPRMDQEILAQWSKGIIATTGCPGGDVQTRLRLGQFDEAVKAAAAWQDIFGPDSYFLELMDHGLPIERRFREDLLRVGKKLNLPLLATNDSHYIHQEDAEAHDSLLCVGTGSKKADTERFKFEGDSFYLRPADEMRALFPDDDFPDACDNTLLVADRVQPYDEVFAHRDLLPRFPVPDGHTQGTWLREETWKGVRARYGDNPSEEVVQRAEFELTVIEKMGFESYFLVVADICAHARDSGIAVGPGRGSAAGSLVAYVLRITELDPLAYGLLFERFLNPDRVSMPDVDLDFDERRRGDMIRYVTEKYGQDNVSMIVTYGGVKAKAAVRDAARILDYPVALADSISKAFPPAAQGQEITLNDIFNENAPRYAVAAPVRDLLNSNPDAKAILETARGLEGSIRQTGVHAAGILLSGQPLIGVMPMIRRESDGAIISGFAAGEAEDLGLLKMDFLGLRNLTIMSDCVKAIKARTGRDIDLLALNLDDAKTYELLSRGDSLGVFQLDGSGTRALLKMMKPDRFDDVGAVIALYRPGPMGAGSHTNYALRKHGHQPITPIHPELEEPLRELLGETYGLIVYQEQVMAIAQKLAGFSVAQADLLRRAMGKKKKAELDKQFVTFEAGMKERGYSSEAVRTIWDILVPFSDYAFNKAHSAGYGLVSYWTAYLKANYPAEYMAALLSSVGDNKDKMAIYLSECRRMGVEVLQPDVNESDLRFTAVGDRTVRFGLGAIRNVGDGAVASIVKARSSGPYRGFADFLDRITSAACNKRVVEALIKAGAFDSFGHSRQGLFCVHERAVEAAASAKKSAAQGQDSLFGDEDASLNVNVPDGEWDTRFLLDLEREMLGLYVSDHPLNGAEEVLAANRSDTIATVLLNATDDEEDEVTGGAGEVAATLCGLVTKVDRRVSKAGNPWAILTIEDLDASVEVLFFGKVYTLFSHLFAKDTVVAVTGKVESREGSVSVVGNDFRLIDLAADPNAQAPIVIQVDERALTGEAVRRLREALRAHPGQAPVRIRLHRPGGGSVLMGLPDYPVQAGPSFAAEIKVLFGASALT